MTESEWRAWVKPGRKVRLTGDVYEISAVSAHRVHFKGDNAFDYYSELADGYVPILDDLDGIPVTGFDRHDSPDHEQVYEWRCPAKGELMLADPGWIERGSGPWLPAYGHRICCRRIPAPVVVEIAGKRYVETSLPVGAAAKVVEVEE